jgi:hypothetical protein
MSKVFFNQEFVTPEAVNEIVTILEDRTRVLNLIHAARSAKKDNLKDLLGQIKVPADSKLSARNHKEVRTRSDD